MRVWTKQNNIRAIQTNGLKLSERMIRSVSGHPRSLTIRVRGSNWENSMHFKSRPKHCATAYRLLIAAIVLLAPLLASAAVLHVDADAAGSNDGSDWANAYTDLQDALGAAQSGDEIWVAAGVYKPGSTAFTTFQLKNEVEIYGGFAGTETTRNERDWRTNVTVLSGDLGSTNSYHVVTATNTNRSALLDGFTITGGSATAATIDRHSAGGGMYNDGASPTLGNVTFSNNYAIISGGGMYTWDGNPKLTNVTFSGNRAGSGGGMVTFNGNPELTNVTFSGNRAHSRGGGGGGMYTLNSNPELTNVTFSNNLAENDGGGMWSNSSQGEIHNTIFWNNRDASGTGTAAASIFNDSGASPTIRYSLVQGCNPEGVWNTACGTDGGDNLADADPQFVDPPGNVRLLARSPAIDAGNNAVISDIDNATDLDGNDRLFGDTVDLGPFETAYLSVTLSTAGTGSGEASVISPVPEPPRFDRDETVTVEALPDQDSVFVGWTGDLTGDDNPLAFTIEADTALTANFVPQSLEVTAATASGAGTINPASQSVDYNGTASFAVHPDAGWSIDSVTGNTCTPSHIGGTDWQAENITENCAVEAEFTIDSFTIGGTVSGLEGEGLILRLNGGDDLAIGADGGFTFATPLADLSDYEVTVMTQPTNPSQTCDIADGSGTLQGEDVTNVTVTCATPSLLLNSQQIAFGIIDAENEVSGEVTLTNNGQVPLTVGEITDPDEPFAVTGGSCLPVPTTLEPGENCTVEVIYAPGSTTGQHESPFEIISDAPSSPDEVQLSGQSISAIPVPINRSATLIALALLLLLGGWWRRRA